MEQLAMVGDPFLPSYDYSLVALSYLMIVFASYTCLQLSVCIRESQDSIKKYWIAACGIIFGVGVWSMHIIAMLAYVLPIPVGYNPWVTFLSLGLVVVPACFSFYLTNSDTRSVKRILMAGIVLGMGIVGMHYTGMAAMRLNAQHQYDSQLVILSVLIAVVVSWVAIALIHWFGKADSKRFLALKIFIAMIIGAAAAGTHYTAMAAVKYYPGENLPPLDVHSNLDFGLLAVCVALFLGGISGTSIVAFLTKRNIQILNRTKDQLETMVNERTNELQSSNQMLDKDQRFIKTLLDNVVDVMITIDERGLIESFNKAAEENFGYREDEVIGKNVNILMPEPYKSEHDSYITRYVNGGAPRIIGVSREVVGLRKDGTIFLTDLAVSEVYFDGRRMFIGIAKDLTEKKEQEQELLEMNRRMELILDSTGEGIYGLDLNGNTTFINPAAAQMMGYEQEELIGKTQHAILHHRNADGLPYSREECPIYAAIRDGLVHKEQNDVFWKKDGSKFPVRYESKPIYENDGIVGAVVTFQDITIEKQMESRRELAYQLTNILAEAQTVNEGMSQILKILVDHPAWDMAFYWSVDSESNVLHCMAGDHSERLSSGNYKNFSEQTLGTSLEWGKGFPGEVWKNKESLKIDNLSKKSDFRRASLAKEVGVHAGFGFPIHSRENFWGVIEVFTIDHAKLDKDWDLFLKNMGSGIGGFIQRKENHKSMIKAKFVAQEAKEQAETARNEADKANKTKSQFLANMSHEIRTPMNAIIGFSQILMDDKEINLEQMTSLQTISKAGNHLLEVINDILDISKIESGQMHLNLADFDLNGLVNNLSMLFKERCGYKGLSWKQEGLNGGQYLVHGDETKLRQILINLLGNAVKFTDSGEVGFVVMQKEDHSFRFEVHDTGKGIPEKAQKPIFDPFRQDSEGIQKGGTGLGLAISKKQVEMMGGYLKVKSVMGEGSRFYFTLNLPPTEPNENRLENNKTENRKVLKLAEGCSVKALIVDDAPDNRALLSIFLKKIGVEIEQAEDGKVALEKIKENIPDIILMDIRMPVMNGLDATKKIFKKYGRDRIKVIAFTAAGLEHEREATMKYGFHDFVMKPAKKEAIYACIKNNLDIEYIYEVDVEAVETEEANKALDPAEV